MKIGSISENREIENRVAITPDIVKKYKDGSFTFPQEIDIVTGGFPCQDFSVSGKRKGACEVGENQA